MGTVTADGVTEVQNFLQRPVRVADTLTLCSQHRRSFESQQGLTAQLDSDDAPGPSGWRAKIDLPRAIVVAVALIIVVPIVVLTPWPRWAHALVGAVVIGLELVVYSWWLRRRK